MEKPYKGKRRRSDCRSAGMLRSCNREAKKEKVKEVSKQKKVEDVS